MYVREITKYIKNKYFFIVVAAIFALMLDEFFTYVVIFNDGGLIAATYYITGSDKLFAMASLLLISIPCVVPISEEISSGCYRNYIFRIGKRCYITSRVISTIIVPMIIVTIALILYLVGYVAVHPNYRYLGYDMGSGRIFETSRIAPRLLFLLSRFFYAGLFCGSWSCVSLAAAAWTNNRYIVLGISFCIENLVQMLAIRGYIPIIFSPFDKINGSMMSYYTTSQQNLIMLIYDIALIAVAAAAFAAGMKRRMKFS